MIEQTSIFLKTLPVWELFILVILIGYGLVLGVPNWIKRLAAIVTFQPLNQHDLGTILDGLWLAGIIVMFLLHY